MKTERITIDNGRGDALAARLDLPLRDRPRAYAVFAHCFTCSKNLTAAVQLSRALVEAGWGVLRFDFTGLGDSDGDFADTHFSSNVADLVAVAQWLGERHVGPRLLIGHSLGGAAVLGAAAQMPTVTAVATLGAPAHPDHVARLLTGSVAQIERDGQAEVELAGRRFSIKKQFLDDIAEQPMQRAIAGLGRALLVMHAPTDATVGIDNAGAIFTAAKHPKSFVSLDGADHLLSRPADARFAASLIASWAQRYLPAAESDTAAESAEVVQVWGPVVGFRTEVEIGEHTMIADEPDAYGGTGTGPSPYEYLLSALGACTSMTVRMYADRKGWPLRQAVTRLRHDKVHARDCAECEEGTTGRIDRIERTVELRGDLTEEQRTGLLEIADKCPVHRTLTQGRVVVVTTQRR